MRSIDYLSIPLFSSLSRIDIARLVPSLQHISCAAGDTLFLQGDKGDALYIIVEGRVSIRKQEGDSGKEVAVLSSGEYFGEMALLSGATRSAAAVAIDSLYLLKISRAKFELLLKKHSSIGAHLANILASRFSDRHDRPEVAAQGNDRQRPLSTADGLFSELLPVRKKSTVVLGGAIAGAAGLALWLPNHGFSQLQAALSGLLLGATILWAFETFSYHAVAVALPVIIVILGLARPEAAFSGFSNPSWFLVLGIFAITSAVGKTGLMYRLVLMLAQCFPKSYRGQTLALALAGLILTPVIPSANGRAALAGPIVRDLCETLKFRKGSPGAIGMAMASLLGFGHMSFLFMNGTAACLLALGLLPPATISTISWGSWFIDALPLGAAFFIGNYAGIILFFRPHQQRLFHHGVVQSQLNTLGPLTRDEKICLLIVVFALSAFITQTLHGINSAWIAMSSFLILFGVNVLDDRSVRSDIDWNYLISFGALVSFAGIISASGLTALAAAQLTPRISSISGSPYIFLPFLALLVTVIRFALPMPAALLIVILAIVPVAGSVGISPFIITQVTLIAGSPWFSPYQNTVYCNFMESSDNRLFSHHQARILSFWQIAVVVAAIIAAIPYWQWRGLIE